MKKNLLFLTMALFAMMGLANAQRPISNFSEGFEDGTLGIMTTIDADGDGHNWMNSSALQVQGDGHNGSARYAYSESWSSSLNRWGLYPDNFLVSPLVAIDETSVFTFYVCLDWYVYPGEHYGVAVSTASNTDPNDFTTIAEWDLDDKGTRDGDQGPWHEHNIDLSQYAGQNIYIAIRHFYCSNIYLIDLDDVSLTSQAGGSCEAPTNFTGQLVETQSSISLSWDAADGAVSYNVYRSETGSDYEMIANVAELQYTESVAEYHDYYYQVTAVHNDGCESSPATTPEGESFLMFSVGDLNVSENGIEAELYPNPSNGEFNIKCQGMTRLTVYGMRGETVMDIATDTNSYTISDLGAGVYFVRIETATGSMTQKIVRL